MTSCGSTIFYMWQTIVHLTYIQISFKHFKMSFFILRNVTITCTTKYTFYQEVNRISLHTEHYIYTVSDTKFPHKPITRQFMIISTDWPKSYCKWTIIMKTDRHGQCNNEWRYSDTVTIHRELDVTTNNARIFRTHSHCDNQEHIEYSLDSTSKYEQ